MIDVDIVGLETAQAVIQTGAEFIARDVFAAEPFLGRDDHLAAIALSDCGADNFLGAIGFGCIDEVNAGVDSAQDKRDLIRLPFGCFRFGPGGWVRRRRDR